MNVSKRASIIKKNNSLLKFLVGAIALLFFITALNFFSSEIKNTFYTLSSPLQKTFWTAGESASNFLSSFANAGNLKNENQSLKNENQKLQAEVASLQSIISGNSAQSAISVASQDNRFKLLMAEAMGIDDYDILSINKGSADGVLENMPVINQQGALFGKVYKVYKKFSEVMLISNVNSVVNVRVRQNPGKSEINGVIRGQGKQNIFLDLVPIDDTINQGDILVTSALESAFPKDILIGTITKIIKNDQNPHQKAEVKPFLDSLIDNLFVILNYKR